jgi:hypothetical protein
MGLDPPYLGDREEQIQRFRDFLEEPEARHNALVTGLRGVGKTVLLKHYTDAAESAGWIVADREWNQNDGEPAAFRQLLLEDLARLALKLSATERVKSAAQGLARSLRDLISGIKVRYEGVEVGYDRGSARLFPGDWTMSCATPSSRSVTCASRATAAASSCDTTSSTSSRRRRAPRPSARCFRPSRPRSSRVYR